MKHSSKNRERCPRCDLMRGPTEPEPGCLVCGGKGWVSPETHAELKKRWDRSFSLNTQLSGKLTSLQSKYDAALEDWHRSDTKLAAAVEALKELNLLQLNWGDTSHTFESSCKIVRETLAKIKE